MSESRASCPDDRHPNHGDDDGSAQVGLRKDQVEWKPGQGQAAQQDPRILDFMAMSREELGQHQDHQDLRQFGGLDQHDANVEPARRAKSNKARKDDERQQQDHDKIKRARQSGPYAVINGGRCKQNDEPDHRENGLPGRKLGQVLISADRGSDHGHPGNGQDCDRRQEPNVEVTPNPGRSLHLG